VRPGSTAISASRRDRAEISALAEVATHWRATATSRSRRGFALAEDRAAARRIADSSFREVYVATSAEVCESRDPKGHYAKARAGALKGFTGIGNDYEPPTDAELVIDTVGRRSSRPPTRSNGCWLKPACCSTTSQTWPPNI